MMLRNGPDSFGVVSRVLHWGIAVLVVVMLSLGLRLEDMEPGLSNLWLYSLHKSLGLLTLALMVLRVLWHLHSRPPRPVGGGWQALAARVTHAALYALLIGISVSGWIASSATGIETMLFDRWVVPAIAPVSEAWEDIGFDVHEVLVKILMVLLALHFAAAIKREAGGDGTLRRIVTGRAR